MSERLPYGPSKHDTNPVVNQSSVVAYIGPCRSLGLMSGIAGVSEFHLSRTTHHQLFSDKEQHAWGKWVLVRWFEPSVSAVTS